MPIDVEPEDLVFHILNVGFGDSIVVELPEDEYGQRSYGIVDCSKYDKTNDYLNKLVNKRSADRKLKFICATHPPHRPHTRHKELHRVPCDEASDALRQRFQACLPDLYEDTPNSS